MTFEQGILLALLGLTALSAWRILVGPSLWDRLLGLNLSASKLVMMIVLLSWTRKATLMLDVALVYALLGFIGVTFMAKMLVARQASK